MLSTVYTILGITRIYALINISLRFKNQDYKSYYLGYNIIIRMYRFVL